MHICMYIHIVCVYIYSMYKSQRFSCISYFCEVIIIAKVFCSSCVFKTLFYCTQKLSPSPSVQQEKPGH